MNPQEAIEYLANYGNYATDGDIRLPDDRIMHVSDFCAEVVAAQQSVQPTPPLALSCECGSLYGVHEKFCPKYKTADG